MAYSKKPGNKATVSHKLVNNEEYICGLYRSGNYTQKQLGQEFGVTTSAISALLKRKGVTTKWTKSTRVTPISTQAAKSVTARLAKFTPEEIKAAKVLLKVL